MTPQEKARELFDRFEYQVRDLDGNVTHTKEESIQCASIAVHEIISLMIHFHARHIADNSSQVEFWQEVNLELLKL